MTILSLHYLMMLAVLSPEWSLKPTAGRHCIVCTIWKVTAGERKQGECCVMIEVQRCQVYRQRLLNKLVSFILCFRLCAFEQYKCLLYDKAKRADKCCASCAGGRGPAGSHAQDPLVVGDCQGDMLLLQLMTNTSWCHLLLQLIWVA